MRHYDVVILGRSLGCLAAATLLSRRDLSVLLLGQGQRPALYRWGKHVFLRRAFTLLAASSPCFKRILHELAQTQRFRQRIELLDPMFSVLLPGRRIEVPPDIERFSREVEREFPEVRQLVDELYSGFSHVNATGDAAFERDVVWPPGTFWEKLETGRVAASLPYVGGEGQQDLLGKFPSGHPYRRVTTLPAMFASNLATPGDQLPPFALARLHGAWTRGVQRLGGGEDELTRFLVERVEAQGGVCRLDRRATRLVVEHGAARAVQLDGDDEPTGAAVVITDQNGEVLADLAGGRGITATARRDWPRLTASAGRFVVSLVVKRGGLPDPLPPEAFVLPEYGPRRDPRRPALHLQRIEARELQERGDVPDDETLLVAETIVPTRGPLTLLEAREAVLATLRAELPFLEKNLIAVDSPHDGLPAYDYTRGERRDVDRAHLTGTSVGPEPMEWLWSVEPPGFLDLSGESVRGPIPGTYLVGKSVLPALGQEGELLAAWSAARLVSKRDRSRQKMRRQMWTKMET
ncbi:MAG TPA: phytoene dehydrogenase [Polyangiaceae bacterium]